LLRARDLTFRVSVVALALIASACGGGSPLLHGAHALDPGTTAGGVGFSGTFVTGATQTTSAPTEPGLPPAQNGAVLNDGALEAAMAPSVAPWVAARMGIAGNNEAGLAFTGRALRVDARHAFESGHLAFSLGAGGNVVWRGSDPNPSDPLSLRSGYGFDIPALVGWQSDAGVLSLWGGARGGMEALVTEIYVEPGPAMTTAPANLPLLHSYAGGVAGLAMGLRHVHVAFELDVFYHWVSGDLDGTAVKVKGLTLAPAGALIFTF
jgi:hypothetical protein